jgi:hypothetical protein
MKPRNAFIAGMLITGGSGILTAVFFGWEVLQRFPTADLAEPFRQRGTHFNQPAVNFVVFSSFALQVALYVFFFFVGLALVIWTALTAKKYLMKSTQR